MEKNAPYDGRAVANFLLDLASERKLKLTQIVILKLLYFSHGWYLSDFGEPLILQDFEAWKHGPVLKVVRDQFKNFGDRPITSRASILDIFSGELKYAEPNLSTQDSKFIAQIFDSYYFYDAWQLSAMTHECGSPWDALWNSSVPVGRLALRIRNEDIKSHFDGLRLRRRLA